MDSSLRRQVIIHLRQGSTHLRRDSIPLSKDTRLPVDNTHPRKVNILLRTALTPLNKEAMPRRSLMEHHRHSIRDTEHPRDRRKDSMYGAPGGPPTPASLGYGAPQIIQWDARPDAQALRSAMKGFGTDEKTLVRVLATKDPLQIDAIRDAYSRHIGRNLEKDIESETRGYLEQGLVALARGPLLNDVHLLRGAISGAGTNEDVLNDVLLGRSNADMHAIKSTYQRVFGRTLEADVKGDLSMKTEQHFMIVLGANRAEESAPVIPQAIDQEVQELYRATEGKMGTDEMLVCSILSTRSDSQIRAINETYERKFRRRLEDMIRKEFSGHMEDALLYQLRSAINKPVNAAKLLEDAMAGMGTKDHLLVSRVIRYHWDQRFMADVKRTYQDRYRKSLASRIKSETSGDYERMLLGCIGESV
ncbi:putative annexin a7 protein [Eutypa lata UCREL1]|uniref:Annexin n=1 Tax=Eutypa lata (strain UCR-EL1) TaxID=1287681 RepID=M7SCF5_EUTLA|nr:putative annexin a7 protein [Eutypa lata UCREL1]